MIRRDFLSLLALFTIDPDLEKLIWIPNKKTIFIPSGINYIDVMAKEAFYMGAHGGGKTAIPILFDDTWCQAAMMERK